MVEPQPQVRLLVLSDLHAFQGESNDKAPSRLAMTGLAADASKMFDDVKRALSAGGVDAVDYVLCAGDITNRADSPALERAWEMLSTLANDLEARLVATAGNHDYASHEDEAEPDLSADLPAEVDPKDALLNLDPPFPAGSDEQRQKYFSYSHAVVADGPALIVTVNSCTYHGLSHEKTPEYNHGRVTPHLVSKLTESLSPYRADKRPRILLIHHHPVQLPHLDLAERSQIKDSNLLLSALESDGEWLIVHGHKHRPWLQYSSGGAGAPTILSAASFAANLGGGRFGGTLRNQFHLIELQNAEPQGELGSGMAGRVRTWSCDPLSDPLWYEAGPKQGFMAHSGFGWRTSPRVIAPRMLGWIKEQQGTLTRAALLEWEPRLLFLIPSDLEQTFALVEEHGDLRITRDSRGFFAGVEFSSAAVPDD